MSSVKYYDIMQIVELGYQSPLGLAQMRISLLT